VRPGQGGGGRRHLPGVDRREHGRDLVGEFRAVEQELQAAEGPAAPLQVGVVAPVAGRQRAGGDSHVVRPLQDVRVAELGPPLGQAAGEVLRPAAGR
jgi:hypothetical protein